MTIAAAGQRTEWSAVRTIEEAFHTNLIVIKHNAVNRQLVASLKMSEKRAADRFVQLFRTWSDWYFLH